jgi:(R)-3-[(carboxymethyl)amino]fatty acid dioxygenase/decarboxylase
VNLEAKLRADGGPGVELCGVDVRVFTATDAARLREIIYRERVVVLRDQTRLAPADYIAFSRLLGTPQIYPIDSYHHPDHPELYISSNLRFDGKRYGVARTGAYWHTDCCFLREPVSFTMLAMDLLPRSRRDTLFVDMAEVWRSLPEALASRLRGRAAFHGPNGRYKVREVDVGKPLGELIAEIAKLSPDVPHPVVIEHPVTGERALYVNEGFTTRLTGLDADESRALLDQLFAFTCSADRVRTHTWKLGDVVLWDNRLVIHRSGGVADDEDYIVFRISIFDGLPFYAQGAS